MATRCSLLRVGLTLALLSTSCSSGCRQRTTGPAKPPALSTQARTEDLGTTSLAFENVSSSSGIKFVYQNGVERKHNAILESLGGGVGAIDYDRDGALDLVLAGGGDFANADDSSNMPMPVGLPSALFRQTEPLRFAEVSRLAAIDRPKQYSHGVAVADTDGDGFQDILLTGFGGVSFWKNQGDGTFTDETRSAKLDDKSWSSSAGWGDMNGDGWLDLYLAHYVDWSPNNHPICLGNTRDSADVCPPRKFEGLDDVIYFAEGDGTFRDGTRESEILPKGKGLGVILADLDHDQDLDVYVANDTVDNFLYLNKGNGSFEEVGLSHGVAVDDKGVPNGSMGIGLIDFDGDLLPDLGVTNYEEEVFALYRNSGSSFFEHISHQVGLGVLGTFYVSFGTVAGDFDCDGDEDIAISNGHVIHHPKDGRVLQPAVMLVNQHGKEFRQCQFASDSYFGTPHLGRGLISADLDQDGDLDLVFANSNESAAILKNTSRLVGSSITVELIGTVSNRDAIGARCVLTTRRGSQLRHRYGGGSYLSTSEAAMHFGLRQDDAAEAVRIHWPSGLVESYAVQSGKKRIRCIEGSGTAHERASAAK